jgi:DMSO/TMAO reductase YedYZ molybdopterin-dependent catalytic subunit
LSSKSKNTERLPPGQSPTNRILRWGIDHPGITSTNPQIDTSAYVLTVDGEVDNPVKLMWSDVQQLPRTVSVSDFHCVEGWSVLDCRWEGVRFIDLQKLAKPKPTAQAATFECADSYRTSLFLSELAGDDVLLAYKLNGEDLEEGLGFPLRLVVPNKYAYKSALWVTAVHFTRGKELGFWERRGYSDSADVWTNDRFRK